MIYIVIIFSFLLETAITNVVSLDSFLIPLFLLTSFSIVYPYFKNKLYFTLTCIILGIVYDISTADSIFINTISFGVVSFFIILCYNYLKYNIYSSTFINIFVIIIYRIVGYLLLVIIGYFTFNYNILDGIYNSFIINIIYGVIIYLVLKRISEYLKTKRY